MNQINEKLRKSCEEAVVTFKKLNNKEYNSIQSNLEWCIGSFFYDKNPVGLQHYGIQSLTILKNIKAKAPRKINKKVIKNLEKAILIFRQNDSRTFRSF